MIYEIASLPVKADWLSAFKAAFGKVVHLLARARGYEGHLLTQGVETPSQFTLIVRWQTLDDHTQGFEPSSDHQGFMAGLETYLSAEPNVYHVRAEDSANGVDLLAN